MKEEKMPLEADDNLIQLAAFRDWPESLKVDRHSKDGSVKYFETHYFDAIPPLAANWVIGYASTAEASPELVLWTLFKRSGTLFEYHGPVKSYRIEQMAMHVFLADDSEPLGYKLIEVTTVSRPDRVTVSVEQSYFKPASPAGEAIVKFFGQIGIRGEEVPFPKFQFVEEVEIEGNA
jgi:hypothetical protein